MISYLHYNYTLPTLYLHFTYTKCPSEHKLQRTKVCFCCFLTGGYIPIECKILERILRFVVSKPLLRSILKRSLYVPNM